MSIYNNINELVDAIHSATETNGNRFTFGITGGGSTCLSHLMAQPGASTTVLEFNCTYSCESTLGYVNYDSDHPITIKSFASLETARELAYASLKRSLKILTTQTSDINKLSSLKGAIGIGSTASLASKSWKRGEHRIYISLTTNEKEITFSLNLFKGTQDAPFRTRMQEDDLCGKLIVCVCAYACGIFDNSSLVMFMMSNGLDEKDILLISDVHIKNPLEYLLDGEVKNVLCIPQTDGTFIKISDVPIHLLGQYTKKAKILALPGSFNPLHMGHTSALQNSIALCDPSSNPQGLYELSIFNVNKPQLTIIDLMIRLEHFVNQSFPILLTKTPRFIDKAQVYPGLSYVIGIDTAIHLLDPKYTEGSIDLMTHMLKDMTDKGTEFLVNPRTFGTANIPPSFRIQLKDSELFTYSMIESYVPYVLRSFFRELIVNEYKDLSSSALRKMASKSI